MANNNKKENIQVYLRVRPLSSPEKRQKSPSVVDIISKKEVCVRDIVGNSNKTFTFDQVFGPTSKQIDVYKAVLHQIIDEVLAGYNCTVFAYGQTGSGKTYTMEGERSNNEALSWENDPQSGIIPRCFSQLFDELHISQIDHTVRVSFLEIYNEELIDLLSLPNDNTKLKLFDDTSRKGSVIVSGLEERTVKSKTEVYKILEKGAAKRQTAATLMNAHSSRSHTIFSITVHLREIIEEEEFFRTGKLNLVDLAGSENIGRSGAIDKRAREAGSINQSLLTLGRVITALVEHRPHVPYRESKLTRMLQDSLGGRTKTSIIATISPASINLEETLSTLSYANRAKCIVNKPEINQKQTPRDLLKEYIDEVDRLRRDLKASRNKEGIFIAEENYNEMLLKIKSCDQETADKINRIRAMEEEKVKLEEIIHELQWKARQQEDKIVKCEEELAEEKYVIEQMAKTEQLLISQAKEVQNVANQAANHVSLLHDKIIRKDLLEQHNREAVIKFYNELAQYLRNVCQTYEHFLTHQFGFLSKQKEEFREKMQCTETVMSKIKTELKDICDKSDSAKTDLNQFQSFLLKKGSDLEELCYGIESTIREVFAAWKTAKNDFFESVVFPGLNDVDIYTKNMVVFVQKYESDLNEHKDSVGQLIEHVNELNKQIYSNVEMFRDISLSRISELHRECSKIVESSDEILNEHITTKQTLLDITERNSTIVNRVIDSGSSNVLLEKQLNEVTETVSLQNSVSTLCFESAMQNPGDIKREITETNNTFSSGVQSLKSMHNTWVNSFTEKAASFEALFEPDELVSDLLAHSCERGSNIIEESLSDISSVHSNIRDHSKECSQSVVGCTSKYIDNVQTYLKKSANVRNSLHSKTTEINSELSTYIDCHKYFEEDKEILTYQPTANTPQRILSEAHTSGSSSSASNLNLASSHSPGKENVSTSEFSRKPQSKLKPPNPLSHIKCILKDKNH